MDNLQNDTNEKIIIIYKGYSLAQKKASATYYQANKNKCKEQSRTWALDHKNERDEKERTEEGKLRRKLYNQQYYLRHKPKQEQEQEQL